MIQLKLNSICKFSYDYLLISDQMNVSSVQLLEDEFYDSAQAEQYL